MRKQQTPAIQFAGTEEKMANQTAGQVWRQKIGVLVQQQVVTEAHTHKQAWETEARACTERILDLIDQAVARNVGHIFVMQRPLNFEDVVCRNVDTFETEVGGNPIRAEQLAGVARIVFDWCVQNDLVCYIHGMGKIEVGMIARLK